MMGKRGAIVLILGVLILITALSLLWGRYPHPGFTSLKTLKNDSMAQIVFWNLRAPRIVTALLLGASLATSGSVFQTVLGNPLVEPGFLGVSQGAAFGAALAILVGLGPWSVPVSAVFFGFAGLLVSWILAKRIRYGGAILRLVLAGIVSSALFSSGLGILKIMADPRSELPEITFWMMGGLTGITWGTLRAMAFPPLLSLVLLLIFRWRVNLMSLDDRSAFALGAAPGRERAFLVALCVVAVATVTAVAGIVSWVGLLIPHISRRLVGADARASLPLSLVLGAIFVLICDDVARGISSGEIPLGLVTSFAGAAVFALLMTQGKDRGAPPSGRRGSRR
ncbi:MAG: iron ABC transporter permease [Spirochaetales bacterium]|nr:iron ABC transporter permease [Spirochaetales bacterium]